MSARRARRLQVDEVYIVRTVDGESMIGAYAGEERGRLVFTTGVLSPLRIPIDKVAEARRIGA